MGSKTDYMENKVLELLRGNTFTAPAVVYSALFTAIPSDAGGGTEVTNAVSGYTRIASTFATASGGQTANANAVLFVTLAAAVTIVGFGLFDAATAGNMLYWSTIATVAFASGDQPTFAPGTLTVAED